MSWRPLARRECPCCRRRLRRFRSFRGRPDARCPNCGSLERHRFMCLLLERDRALSREVTAVLHLAPEPPIEGRLRALAGASYRSADLEPGRAMDAADITELPYPGESFDLVVVSHVLEHVPDDRRALAELHRVLRPDGRALLQHPIDPGRTHTHSDPALGPEQRLAAFGQEDHVRAYGHDFEDRLREAGFDFSLRRDADLLSDEELERFGVRLDYRGERVGCDVYQARRST